MHGRRDYCGLDIINAKCILSIRPRSFSALLEDYGIPRGNKSIGFTAVHAAKFRYPPALDLPECAALAALRHHKAYVLGQILRIDCCSCTCRNLPSMLCCAGQCAPVNTREQPGTIQIAVFVAFALC